MERPDNDDLHEYYNRAATQRGKNKRSQDKSGNKAGNVRVDLSKDKDNKKMERIYMQRLDGSQAQMPRSKSRGRY